MKINGTKYDTMFHGMQAVVKHLGGPVAVKATFEALTERRMLWDLWHTVDKDLRYDDAHPNFQSGGWIRVIPQNPTFDVFSDGVNDAHIETTLRRIGQELGII
jgi:hypothetical protein